jgi:6-phosphogluconolactonase (cycloisomerase 2 family)
VPGSPFPAGENPEAVAADPRGRFLYVTLNKFTAPVETLVRAFRVDAASGALTPIGSPLPTGLTPVALAVDPRGRFVYVASNANGQAGAVWAYVIHQSSGALTGVPGSPFAAGDGPSWVAADPTGRFLYVANSTGSSISGFAIDDTTGMLAPLPGSPYAVPFPAALAIEPGGRFLYVSGGAQPTARAFAIDPTTGALAAIGSPQPVGRSPGSVTVHPRGIAVYVANLLDNTISAYAVDPGTGALTAEFPGSPFSTIERPFELVVMGLHALPDAAVGAAYSQTPTPAGFTPPFSFTLAAGALPAGVTLDPSTGTIAGTPATGGIFQFRVEATDAAGRLYNRSLGLRVTGGAGLTISPPSGTLLTTQGFGLALVLQGTGTASVTTTTGRLDGADVSAPLAACVAGNVRPLVGGGQVVSCPGLSGSLLGPGVHTFEATVGTSDGATHSSSVTWDVKAATEP